MLVLKDVIAEDFAALNTVLDSHCASENLCGHYVANWKQVATDLQFVEAISFCDSIKSWRQYIEEIGADRFHDLKLAFSRDVVFSFSYSNPFFNILRDNTVWLMFEIFHSINHAKLTQGNLSISELDASLSSRIRIATFQCSKTGVLFCLGPFFQSKSSFEEDADEDVTASIDQLIHMLKWGGGKPLSKDRMLRHLRHRGWLTGEDAKRRIDLIAQSVHSVIATRFEVFPTAPEIYWISISYLVFLRNKGTVKPWRLFQSRSKVVDNIEIRVGSRNYGLVCEGGDCDGLKFVRISSGTENPISGTVYQSGGEARPTLEHVFGEFSSSYVDGSITNRNAFFLERILMLRLWFQANYSVALSPDVETNVLDTLCQKIRDIFSLEACSIYQLDTLRDRSLKQLGSSFLEPIPKNLKSKSRELMINSSRRSELRRQSVCYRAIDDCELQYFQDIDEPNILLAEGEPKWSSVIAIPLLTRGQVAGAIEIKAKSKGRLFRDHHKWLEEIVRIIMPTLSDRWLIRHLNSLYNIPTDKKLKFGDRYRKLVEEFGRVFFADSATLYLKSETDSDELTRKAAYGRSFPNTKADIVYLGLGDTSVTASVMSNKMSRWVYGTFGEEGFAEGWLSKANNAWLPEHGHKYIGVIPIRDMRGDEKPFASITITSKSKKGFSHLMEDGIDLVAREFAVALNTIWRLERSEVAQRQEDAHSVKTRAPRMIAALERVTDIIEPITSADDISSRIGQLRDILQIARASSHIDVEKVAPHAERTIGIIEGLTEQTEHVINGSKKSAFNKAMDDLRGSIGPLVNAAIVIAGGADPENPNFADPKTWNGTWTDLRAELIYSIKNADNVHVSNNVSLPTQWEMPSQVLVRVPGIIISEIIHNLIDNAIKYDAVKPSSVKVSSYYDPNYQEVSLTISNRAPKLSASFLKNVGNIKGDDARSAYARKTDSKGSGLGLYYAKRMASKWGFEIKYECESIGQGRKGRTRLVVHNVSLNFPTEIVRPPPPKKER